MALAGGVVVVMLTEEGKWGSSRQREDRWGKCLKDPMLLIYHVLGPITSFLLKDISLRIVPSLLHQILLFQWLIPSINKCALIVPIKEKNKTLLSNFNQVKIVNLVNTTLLKQVLSKLPMISTQPNSWSILRPHLLDQSAAFDTVYLP